MIRPLNILHVVPSYLPAYRYGGTIYAVHGLCKSHVSHGHIVTVFTTNSDGPDNLDVPLNAPVDRDGVKVWYFPIKQRRFFWAPALKKAIIQRIDEFDIVHVHSIFLWPTTIAALVAEKAKVPYVISIHGMLIKELIRRKSRWLKTAWLYFFGKYMFEHASLIRVTSEYELQELQKFGFKLPPVVKLINAIEIEDSHESYLQCRPPISKAIASAPYILFLSRLNWKKGLDRLIEALCYISHIRLIIAGNDDDNYRTVLDALIKKYNVGDRITFLGSVYGKDKLTLYRNATLFVLPSYSENFGNVVLEAMSAACPVVVTPEVGAGELVQVACAGLVADGEPKTFAHAINTLLSKPQQLKEMGQAGQNYIKRYVSWDNVGLEMEMYYQKIVDNDAKHYA